MLANKDMQELGKFTISRNVSKRVIRSSLILKVYRMITSIDIGIMISTTLKRIIKELGMPLIEIIIYIDSYSLYKCLVKLSTTKEKRLIINIISL
ncbi:hypothetical protein LOCC1_G008833 [Lachnellula occidentalis]|uniref:Uncharacterized protein n=1 Tax=Lachnellula occidentalis TaxID=215460 RepID=A0A8H8RQB2_9HELO|nr:hypothetical protein LOCC1_G008833 [Lachnellula occidentalis]